MNPITYNAKAIVAFVTSLLVQLLATAGLPTNVVETLEVGIASLVAAALVWFIPNSAKSTKGSQGSIGAGRAGRADDSDYEPPDGR